MIRNIVSTVLCIAASVLFIIALAKGASTDSVNYALIPIGFLLLTCGITLGRKRK